MFWTCSCCPHAAEHVSLWVAFGFCVYLDVFAMVAIENPLPSKSWNTPFCGIGGTHRLGDENQKVNWPFVYKMLGIFIFHLMKHVHLYYRHSHATSTTVIHVTNISKPYPSLLWCNCLSNGSNVTVLLQMAGHAHMLCRTCRSSLANITVE